MNRLGGDIGPLWSHLKDAKEVANWLRGEDYDVGLLAQETDPVHTDVRLLLMPPTTAHI
jgi:hypothetical protein